MVDQTAWNAGKGFSNRSKFPCFTYNKAVEFIKAGYSCLQEVETQKQIDLPPRFMGQIDVGIREVLDTDIMKYSDELDGIIVCYKQVQCRETSGCIFGETPFVHFMVNLKYIVFRPHIGAKLLGKVNRVGHGHYGCLVLEYFNASIHKLKVDPSKQSKKFLKRITEIDVGSEFVFRIKSFHVHNEILSIKGKIDEEDFNKIRNPDKKLAHNQIDADEHSKTVKNSLNYKQSEEKIVLVNGEIHCSSKPEGDNTSSKQTEKTEIDEKVLKKKKSEGKSKKDKVDEKIQGKKKKRKHSEISQNTITTKLKDKGIRSDHETKMPTKIKKRSKN